MNPQDKSFCDEVEARLEAATPGPWFDIEHQRFKGADHRIATKEDGDWDSFANIATAARQDAPLIAHAPTDLRRLLKLVVDQDAENKELKKNLDDALVRAVEDQDEHSAQRAALAKENESLRKANEESVEAALLAELRELFPSEACSIASVHRSGFGSPPDNEAEVYEQKVTIWVGSMPRGEGTTLSEAMAKARSDDSNNKSSQATHESKTSTLAPDSETAR